MLEELRCAEGMQKSILRAGRKGELELKGDKCIVKPEQFKILFTEAGRRIVDYIEKKLFAEFSDISQIILVGEFAQSPILQNIIKTAFSAKNVIIPWDGSMAAVRGAVFYGQGHVSFVTDVSKLNFIQVPSASFLFILIIAPT